MTISLLSVFLLTAALVVWLFILGQMSQKGNPPGLVEGKLAQCPDKRNCVCSEYPNDSLHFIQAIKLIEYKDEQLMSSIKTTVQEMGGVIQREQENYLAFTFTSSTFGFVDDLEIRVVPGELLVHVRSGSRVGDSDLGVNRKRVDQFRNRVLEHNQNN